MWNSMARRWPVYISMFSTLLHDNLMYILPGDDPLGIETCRSLLFNINNSNKHIVYLVGC